jgi:hypothetical protein
LALIHRQWYLVLLENDIKSGRESDLPTWLEKTKVDGSGPVVQAGVRRGYLNALRTNSPLMTSSSIKKLSNSVGLSAPCGSVIDLLNHKQRKAAEEETAAKIAKEVAPVFHDAERKPYANVPRNQHRETYRIDSEDMDMYLRQEFFEATKEAFRHGMPLPKDILKEIIDTLTARALFEGPEEKVYLRTGEADGALYIDLVDAAWRAIRITGAGWDIVDSPPIYFRRSDGMLALPIPETRWNP